MNLSLTAAALLGVAAVVGWAAGPGRRSWLAAACWVINLAAAILVVIAAGDVLATGPRSGTLAGVTGTETRIDNLSALFLLISFGVAIPALIAALTSRGQAIFARLGACAALIQLTLLIVIIAGNLFTLVLGWEGLGVAFYLAVGFQRTRPGRSRAATITLGFSSFSGAAILLAGALLFAHSHTLELAGLAHDAPWTTRSIAYALFIAGFAVKVGLMPLHLWLPPAYASAPGPLRALMAGSAVNAGFYGLWRTLETLGTPPTWIAAAVLIIGGITAILGVSHAAVHADLAYLIGWSSIENAGVILSGYGVALVGAIIDEPQMLAAGLLAATAQVIAHALGKSLLFLALAGIEDAYRTTDLDRLRSVARSLPYSGAGLVIGALTLAGVPLTAGFASEWLTLEALMQQFRVHNLPLDLCLAVTGALVALTIGVASLAFVRVIALSAFGPANRPPRELRYESSTAHRIGVVLLAFGCLGVAAIAPLQIRLIARGLDPLTDETAHAITGTWVLQPVYSGFSALSPSWLWLVIPGYVLLTIALAWVLSSGRLVRVRRVPAWRSASPGVSGGWGYTSFAFANPMRKVLTTILLTRSELHELQTPTPGPEADPPARREPTRLGYTVDVTDVFERYLYRPMVTVGRAVVRAAKRFQSGRLDAYMAYMLVAVLAILAVVAGLAH